MRRAIKKSKAFFCFLTLFAFPVLGSDKAAGDSLRKRHQSALEASQSNPDGFPEACQLASLCYEMAGVVSDNNERLKFADAGIQAAEKAVSLNPNHGAGYYLKGKNLGQKAQAQKWLALKLVREMEKLFLKAVEFNPGYHQAGPHRLLGQLYLKAPGWPASVGDPEKARRHLTRAVELNPLYPSNILALLDAAILWENQELIRSATSKIQNDWSKMKEQYPEENREWEWDQWNRQRKELLRRLKELE